MGPLEKTMKYLVDLIIKCTPKDEMLLSLNLSEMAQLGDLI